MSLCLAGRQIANAQCFVRILEEIVVKKIYKYALGRDGEVVTYKGKFERFLQVQVQNGIPYVWIVLDDDMPEVYIDIAAIGTGWDLPTEVMEQMGYIGTAQDGFGFVWHYFWTKTPEGPVEENPENNTPQEEQ